MKKTLISSFIFYVYFFSLGFVCSGSKHYLFLGKLLAVGALGFWGSALLSKYFEKRRKKTVRFRFHRGSLSDSLETTVYVWSRKQLLRKIRKHFNNSFKCTDFKDLRIEPYGGIDERCGWDTHIVTFHSQHFAQGRCVAGFTDGMLE